MRDYESGIEIEETLLAAYGRSQERKDATYEGISREGLIQILRLKTKNNGLFMKRAEAARDVIDMIAKHIGIDPDNTGYWLYAPDSDGSSPIIEKMDNYFSRSGDKVKLKKRIDELETENAVLRSLLQK